MPTQTGYKTNSRRLVTIGAWAAIALLSSWLIPKNIDFRVYWFAARAFMSGSLSLYGPASGLGFPMTYRYPPVTYLFLIPFSALPLRVAGFIWELGAWAAGIGAALILIRKARLRFTRYAAFAAWAAIGPYGFLAIRLGNVQQYLIAIILAAICLAESRPMVAALLLALAITFKVWPLFFLPWFLRTHRRRVLAWLFPAVVLLWLIPFAVWTPSRYLDLLRQWFHSELQYATTTNELWYFPGQSLRGILLRYLTAPDSSPAGFPDIHLFALSPAHVVVAWEIVAGGCYLAICAAMLRAGLRTSVIWDGVAFASFTALEPFCLKSSMISIAPAALIAASVCFGKTDDFARKRAHLARALFLSACFLQWVTVAAQYRPLHRFFLTLGLDFYSTLFQLAALMASVPG